MPRLPSAAVLLAALFLAVPAGAQEARVPARGEIAAIEACVARVSERSGPAQVAQICAGRMRGGCGQTASVDIADCLMAEAAAWDTLLNAWWRPMRDRAKANGTWNGLLQSQRRWIAEKEAACDRAYQEGGGGSWRVVAAATCQRDRTARKAAEFYVTLYR